MFESIWIVLTVLQGPALPPLHIGIPDDIAHRRPPGIEVSSLLAAPQPVVPVVAAAGPLPAPAPAAGPRRIRGKSEFSYVSTGGTAETQTIGTSGELTFTPPHWRIETRAAYLRNHVDDQLRARRLTGQFRAARALGDRAELFGRATYLRNTFAGIDNSWDAAAGITAILLQSDPQRLSVDSGFGYLTEDRTQGLGRDLASVDFGLRYIREFSKRNRFTNDTALKADIERTSDWRLTHVAAIQAGLNSMLSLKFSHELNYRNEPVPGFTRSDTVASAAVVATF